MKKALAIFLLFLSVNLFATHIVGGELIYDFLGKDANGKDIYRITLKVYRDCLNGQAPFDGPGEATQAWLTILGNGRDTVVNIGGPVITKVPPSINSNCIQAPYTCVEEGIYTYTLALEPAAGGYSLIYQRCCRNNTILNLIDPGTQGSTYYAHIPGPEDAIENSSPRYSKFPPLFLCNNLPFFFDHSAVDPDGDILLYSLAGSINGLDQCCPGLDPNGLITPQNCPNPPAFCPKIAPPPPYVGVNYLAPFDPSYPVASNPSLTIDPITGKLTGKPNMLGQFVVCIQVQEFRNGKLIGVHFRDFQFNIAPCVVSVISDMADQVFRCIGNVITFTNQSVGDKALTYKWDFGVPSLLNDTSNAFEPTFTYQDTGQYVVTLIGNPGKDCSDTMRKTFYVYPPLDIKFPYNQPQCVKANTFDFKTEGTHLPSCKFFWEFGPEATPSVTTVRDPKNVRFDTSGKFFVKLVATQLTCRDSFIDSVRVIPRPVAKIGTPPFAQCVPATLTFSNTSSSRDPMKTLWEFNDGKRSEEKDYLKVFTRSGVYSASLTIITDGICKDTSRTSVSHVTIFPLPVAGFSFYPRVTTILDPIVFIKSTAGPGLTYDYTFGDGMGSSYHNAEHVYFDYGNYTITQYVTNEFGCKDSAQDIVQILPEHRFWIPSAFTPNNDSKNDIFYPVLIGVSQYHLQVFDRWGSLLWETENPLEGWNGMYHGEECKQDVYVWKVRYKDVLHNETFEKNGHVTLIKDL